MTQSCAIAELMLHPDDGKAQRGFQLFWKPIFDTVLFEDMDHDLKRIEETAYQMERAKRRFWLLDLMQSQYSHPRHED